MATSLIPETTPNPALATVRERRRLRRVEYDAWNTTNAWPPGWTYTTWPWPDATGTANTITVNCTCTSTAAATTIWMPVTGDPYGVEWPMIGQPDAAWQQWNGEYFEAAQQQALTEEQARTRLAEQEARRIRVTEAKARAHDLLLSLLTPEQRSQHERQGSVVVRSVTSGRRYRVNTAEHHGRHGNIYELGEGDVVLASLCCAPGGDIPHFDAVLGQIVALQFDEDAFRRAANFTPRVAGYRAPERRAA